MQRLFFGLFFSVLFVWFSVSCSGYDEAGLSDSATAELEIPEPRTGEDGAVATLGDFMESFFAQTRSWNSRPAVSGVRTTSTAAYGGAAATRSGDDGVPVYEITLQNPDGTEGFAMVVEPEQYAQNVVAFVPVGAIADTVFNKGLSIWLTTLRPTLTTDPGGLKQEDWERMVGKVEGSDQFVEYATHEEWLTGYFGPVHSGWAYGPLLKTEWAQTAPYNNRVPDKIIGTNENCRVGCFPVALGQVMAYHKHPAGYNWDLLTATPKISVYNTAAANEVSRLLSDIATYAGTRYNPDSGAGSTYYGREVPTLNYFGYNVTSNNIGNGKTAAIIHDEILQSRPVAIAAQAWSPVDPEKRSGHIWVADGTFIFERWYYTVARVSRTTNQGTTVTYERWRYRTRGTLLHCNWGWGGLSNGWYYNYDPVYTDGHNYYFSFAKYLFTGISPK